MTAPWNTLPSLILLAALAALAVLVFWRVRVDYRSRGQLSRPVAVLQFAYFAAYAMSSYAFLDSRLAHIAARGWLLAAAILLLAGGLAIVLFSMPFLGRRSFGNVTGRLYTDGLYHYSRNPQLVGFLLFIAGYALLWPSWQGAAWVGLWFVFTPLMVWGEEKHLQDIFGEEYRAYCRRTPRFLGLPRSDE